MLASAREPLKRLAPDVSVVLPYFNGSRYIRQQVDSILGQRDVSVQLVIVDDGSDSDSSSALVGLCSALPEVVLRRLETNGGQQAALRVGLDLATAPLVAFADQDDVWLPDKLSLSIAALERTGARAVAMGLIPVRAVWSRTPMTFDRIDDLSVKRSSSWRILYNNPVYGCTMLAERDFVRDLLPPPTLVLHDQWIAYESSRQHAMYESPLPVILYRQHALADRGWASTTYDGLVKRSGRSGGMVNHLRTRRARIQKMLAAASEPSREERCLKAFLAAPRVIRFACLPLYLGWHVARRPLSDLRLTFADLVGVLC